jgi:hypothetical protein
MTERSLIRFGLNGIAGFLGFGVMGFGLWSAMSIDARFNPLLSTLYYVLLVASFPVVVIGFFWKRAAIVQVVLLLGYVVVSAILGWRQCSSIGYCTSVASVVLVNLESKPVLAFLGTAVASLTAMALREESPSAGRRK